MFRLGVAVYAKSVIPRTILTISTSYILNLCILPTLETDSFENFSDQLIDVNEQIRSLGQDWIKFWNYALINKDQVCYNTVSVGR